MSMDKPSNQTIDEYIDIFPKEVQEILQTIRKMVKDVSPDPTESISYGIPTFKVNGKPLIYFAAFKDHISVYPVTPAMETVKEISEYRTGKGTLQFKLKNSIPFDLIQKLIKLRVREKLSEVK